MSDDDKKKSLGELQALSEEFGKRAEDYRRQKENVDAAIRVMKKNKAIADQIIGSGKKSAPKHSFFFLVDGSGSMMGMGGFQGSSTQIKMTPTPIKMTLSSLSGVLQAAAFMQDTAVNSGMWGYSSGVVWTSSLDFSDPRHVQSIENGLNSGTDLAPTVADLQSVMGQMSGSKTRQHVVIVSDGDIFDAEKSRDALKDMLHDDSRLTVDFVLIGKHVTGGTTMGTLADEIKAIYPKRVSRTNVTEPTERNIFTEIVVARRSSSPKSRPQSAPKH